MKKILYVFITIAMLIALVPLRVVKATSSSPSFQITTTQLPSATVGVSYNANIDFKYITTGTNYATNATFSGLPSGITTGSASSPNTNYGIIYNNPGSVSISGTPTTAGTYNVTLTLTDQYSATLSKQFTLVVNPSLQITTTSLPDTTTGQSYSYQLQATGGVGSISWAITDSSHFISSSLCCVLSVNSNGYLSGTLPTNAIGSFYYIFKVTDSVGNTATKTLNLSVKSQALDSYSILSDTKLPDATVGQTYASGIEYTSNNTYALNSSFDKLPSGLRTGVGSDTLNNYGMTPALSGGKGTVYISGTPTTPGTYTINLQINNPNWGGSGMAGASKQFTLTVKPTSSSPSFQITTTQLPSATVGVSYNANIDFKYITTGTNYATNATFSGLPSGITTGSASSPNTNYGIIYNNPGSVSISGTPTTAGTYNVTLTLTDQYSATLSKQFTLVVGNSVKGNLIPSSTFFDFNVKQGEANPATTILHLTNSSSESVNYTISIPNQPVWLNCSYNTQTLTLGAGQVAGVCVAVDATKVSSQNTYTTNLVISGNFVNSPITIPIKLVVSPSTSTTQTQSTSGINLPDGTVIKLPGSPTVYLISGGQLKPFTSAEEFLGKGYKWTDVKQTDSSQVSNTNNNPSGFYPYPSGSLVNDDGTVYFVSGHNKIPFTNYQAFVGLGYSFKNVVEGDLTNYILNDNYSISTTNMAHPWGSWLMSKGTVYYLSQDGLIGVPSSQIFTSNGGNWNLLVKANSQDMVASVLSPMVLNDPRVIK